MIAPAVDRSAPAAAATRILVVRNGFIGDTVLSIPFLRNLRRRFPDAVIDVLVAPGTEGVLADCPYKNALLAWRRPPRGARGPAASLANVLATARRIRGRGYDRAYVLKRSLSSALLVRLAGIPHRVGFASWQRSPLLTRGVPIRPRRHEVELFLDLLRADGVPVDDGRNENWVAEPAARRVDGLLAGLPPARPRVFVAPESTDIHRRWPLGRMAGVIARLVGECGCEVFLCGSRRDAGVHAAILSLVGPAVAAHVHDHSADLSLREAVALLSRMDLCLGVDTGLPHIAASLGVPVVKLYGPTDPCQWHPWMVAGEVVVAERPAPTPMLGITPAQVIAAARRLLGSAATRRAAAAAPMKSYDFREGGHRYEVIAAESPAVIAPGAPRLRAAAVPATKPLAQAH
ncbi:MAG: lipopolysaccharide heptosyltransferase family protein [Planctomycetia bacterium]|nr:lipopolysaccharide heptosyltransferase family protein [Planctomycetia bacterium]